MILAKEWEFHVRSNDKQRRRSELIEMSSIRDFELEKLIWELRFKQHDFQDKSNLSNQILF